MVVVLFIDPRDGTRKPGDAIVGPFKDVQAAERWLTEEGWSRREGLYLGNYWVDGGRLVVVVRLEKPEPGL